MPRQHTEGVPLVWRPACASIRGAMRARVPRSPEAGMDEEAAATDDDEEMADKYDHSAWPHAPGVAPCAPASATDADGVTACWLLGLGLLTRFYGLNWPRQVVFDEVHFGKFVGGYISGRYFFDIHPPLGKLLIALAAWAAGYDGRQPFEHIGEAYLPGVQLFALRAVPATFGALLVPLTYLIVRRMGGSSPAALLAGGIVLLDGAALVESRLLLTDSILFFFELLQLYGMLLTAQTTPNTRLFHRYLALTGTAIGCAMAVKWTALATMAVVGLDTIRALLVEARAAVVLARREGSRRAMRPWVASFAARFMWLLALPAAIYVMSFVAHVKLLPLTGAGDKFHGASFRCRLAFPPRRAEGLRARLDGMAASRGWAAAAAGTRALASGGVPLPSVEGAAEAYHGCTLRGCDGCEGVEPLGLFGAIIALNRRMLSANAGIQRGHAFGSGWLLWPLNSRPVFYWKLDLANHMWCRIYMAGNPIAWRLCLVGMCLLALMQLGRLLRHWRRPLSLLMGSRRGLGLSGTKPCWQMTPDCEAGTTDCAPGAEAVAAAETSPGAPAAMLAAPPPSPPDPSSAAEAGETVVHRYAMLLLVGHLMAWLPFAWVSRVAFLYHYIPALLLSVLATALAFDALTRPLARVRISLGPCGVATLRDALAAALLLLVALSSLYFLPLYLGWPLHPDDSARRTHRLDPWGDAR